MINTYTDGIICPYNLPTYFSDGKNWTVGCIGCEMCYRNRGHENGKTKCLCSEGG